MIESSSHLKLRILWIEGEEGKEEGSCVSPVIKLKQETTHQTVAHLTSYESATDGRDNILPTPSSWWEMVIPFSLAKEQRKQGEFSQQACQILTVNIHREQSTASDSHPQGVDPEFLGLFPVCSNMHLLTLTSSLSSCPPGLVSSRSSDTEPS